MSMKERFEKWCALWVKLTAEVEDEEFEDAAKVICDRCGGRATADCAACPVRTGRPLDLGLMNDEHLAAAIADLECFSECEQCAHYPLDGSPDCEACDYYCERCLNKSCPCLDCDHGSRWAWRGPRRTLPEDHDVG